MNERRNFHKHCPDMCVLYCTQSCHQRRVSLCQMASTNGLNNNIPWADHWSGSEQSAHSRGWDQFSALRSANRVVGQDIPGNGNCCPRALVQQIVHNDAIILANPALAAYRVSPHVARDHVGLRVQFVQWLRDNAHSL